MSEQSSNTSLTASAFYDPESSCWRTSQESLLSEVPSLLERLPDWGTTAAGALCVQATPERLIAERDGSASPNLPTPTASDQRDGKALRKTAWWDPQTGGSHSVGLNHLFEGMALLPTPTVNNAKESGTQRDWGGDLTAALLPTPTTVDSHSAGRSQGALLAGDTLHLNLREAVKMLPTSAPTTKESDDGNGSSDDEHPPQPMIEYCDPSLSSG